MPASEQQGADDEEAPTKKADLKIEFRRVEGAGRTFAERFSAFGSVGSALVAVVASFFQVSALFEQNGLTLAVGLLLALALITVLVLAIRRLRLRASARRNFHLQDIGDHDLREMMVRLTYGQRQFEQTLSSTLTSKGTGT